MRAFYYVLDLICDLDNHWCKSSQQRDEAFFKGESMYWVWFNIILCFMPSLLSSIGRLRIGWCIQVKIVWRSTIWTFWSQMDEIWINEAVCRRYVFFSFTAQISKYQCYLRIEKPGPSPLPDVKRSYSLLEYLEEKAKVAEWFPLLAAINKWSTNGSNISCSFTVYRAFGFLVWYQQQHETATWCACNFLGIDCKIM